jgi:hypothetical protein
VVTVPELYFDEESGESDLDRSGSDTGSFPDLGNGTGSFPNVQVSKLYMYFFTNLSCRIFDSLGNPCCKQLELLLYPPLSYF